MLTTPPNSIQENEREHDTQKISTFRRVLPQIFGTCAKNLMTLNLGGFEVFPSIVIPSLIGISNELNPDETLQLTASQTSWLSSLAHMAHLIGSILSGPLNDIFGRRNAIIMVCCPLALAWFMLGFSYSFPLICIGFALIGLSFGLNEAPSNTYITEISEPSIRGMMMTITMLSYNIGIFIILGFGSILSWRQVSLVCSLFPIICAFAVILVPESPSWLMSKGLLRDAHRSLQRLRGWVCPEEVHNEFISLQEFSSVSNACAVCSKQSLVCNHARPTFLDKIKELRRKRNLKPCLLIFCLQFFNEFCGFSVWQPYIFQVLKALGTPFNPNTVTVIGSGLGILTSIFLFSTVKLFGRRKIYLSSTGIVSVCCFGLSIYGFVLLPNGWMSFTESPNDFSKNPEYIQKFVGNYSFIALALVLIMQFFARIGIAGMPMMFVGEVFPFKSRSILCGFASVSHYILASIATKTYYNVEAMLSLPGAILFYGWISMFGFIVMFLILPETEQHSLQDIELHYSDNSKAVTDIYISKRQKYVE